MAALSNVFSNCGDASCFNTGNEMKTMFLIYFSRVECLV